MATYDTPLASLPVAPAARPASRTPLASAATRRRTLGAIGTVTPRSRLADRPAILLALASLPFLALAAAIRRRRARSGAPPARAE
jgi:hypothetical protein